MKLRLLTLLAAAALAAAPAAAQTIKSLGYNATNGFIVYSGTNALTFTNALQFATNARAATRTNFGATTVGDAVFTATNAAAAATAIGLGTTNSVSFNQIVVQGTVIESGIAYTGEYIFATDDENSASPVFLFDGDGAQRLRANARGSLGLGLPALTQTSNVTMMRALAGSTNTNEPFSGSISVVGTNNTNTLVFSNGILLEAP